MPHKPRSSPLAHFSRCQTRDGVSATIELKSRRSAVALQDVGASD